MQGLPCLCDRFSFFPRNIRGSKESKNPFFFFVVFLAMFQKSKGKKIRVVIAIRFAWPSCMILPRKTRCSRDLAIVFERKKHINIKKYPENPPGRIPPKNPLCGVLFLENKGEEAPPHKNWGSSNLYIVGTFNALFQQKQDAIFKKNYKTRHFWRHCKTQICHVLRKLSHNTIKKAFRVTNFMTFSRNRMAL